MFPTAGAGTRAESLSDTERRIIEQAEKLVPYSLSLLEKTVNINSGTQNPKGVKKTALVFKAELDQLGLKTRYVNIPQKDRGGHLFAETKAAPTALKVLLLSHTDTVFEQTSPFQKFVIKQGRAFGPGVNDAKGGIVVMITAMKALKAVGALSQMNLRLALMGDEEAPASNSQGPLRQGLRDMAKKSDVALGFEYALESLNKATVARRGWISWRIEVSGQGGHSSRIFSPETGAGSVFSAFYIVNSLREKLPRKNCLSFNPALALGGTNVSLPQQAVKGSAEGKPNVVAKKAIVTGDLRFLSEKQLFRAKTALKAATQKALKGTKAEIVFNERDYSPPAPPSAGNTKLLSLLSQVSRDLGYGKVTALDPCLRGTADMAFIARDVRAFIDGLGALGEGAHSENESLDLDTLPKLIKRTALFLYRLKDFEIR